MKTIIAALTLALSSSLPAQEILFKSAQWDNLAIPLQITPFYLQIKSPTLVTAVSLEMDMYIKGEFTRTIASGGLRWDAKPAPMNVNSAIYFKPIVPVQRECPRDGFVLSYSRSV
jgi:hypothetical protein